MALTVADCPFCEIVLRDDPDAREVYTDKHVVAFFPTEPAVLGHTMVVPRKHMADIWELDEETAAHMARATVRLAGAIREAVHPEGLNVIQSNRKAATQTVLHLHVHLVPRWEGDAMGRIWPEGTSYSEDQKDRTLRAVQEACRRIGAH
ncbi:HIT family protein [Bogoriella caseilytica]|uniref:Histidine triad (HIT) family protein n=1 Tax=Bogoriella caseilytica TaxID=56055 RepID=A0A3N2BAT9_9MICO|nr:HIT domain-containing protein [Bogoriella caseilytica]ROR72393.1 histidine triad (HIT) family protein [Bogoriella caseilytica]